MGLVALLALMAVAMSPPANGDDDRVITLEQDKGYTGEGIRLKITVQEEQGQNEAGPSEFAQSHYEYRYIGSFFSPCLEEI